MCVSFLLKFFDLALPVPGVRYHAGIDAKSDLKLLLEIATNSRLKQGQDKKNDNKQIFYCRSMGKECFRLEVQFNSQGQYQILSDYSKIKHKNCCEKSGEGPIVIKIYNLMMLKRDLLEQFMDQNYLNSASPQTILQRISGEDGQYFYNSLVPSLEDRRKLKKRFDNIINITIKKKKEVKIEQYQIKIQEDTLSKKLTKKKSIKQSRPVKIMKQKQNNQNIIQQYQVKEQVVPQTQKQKDEYYLGDDYDYGRPRKRTKYQSNCSIYSCKGIQEMKGNNNSQSSPAKGDSIFQQEQQDYFKKNSEINIALNMLNEAGSHNYWPQSNNSIDPGNPTDRLRMDDLFASIRNSLIKSLQRKSLHQIDYNIMDGLQPQNENLN